MISQPIVVYKILTSLIFISIVLLPVGVHSQVDGYTPHLYGYTEEINTAMDLIANIQFGKLISRNETWYGTVYVNESIHIPNGLEITVLAGTNIIMAQNVNISCEGLFVVMGEGHKPVPIKCKTNGNWGGIGAINGGKIVIENATISNATVAVIGVNATIVLKNVSISGSVKPQVIGMNNTDINMSGITVTKGKGPGIGIYKSNLKAISCNISANGYYGIYTHSSVIDLIEVSIEDNEFGGILAVSSKIYIKNSDINQNKGFGIAILSSVIELKHTNITLNTLYGIYANMNSYLLMVYSIVSSNYYGGVLLMSSSADIVSCEITKNYGNGIELLGIDVPFETYMVWTAIGNNVPTEYRDIHYISIISNASANITLSNITLNRMNGIYCFASTLRIDGCLIEMNSGIGLFFEYLSKIYISNTTFNKNGGIGLYGYESTPLVIKDSSVFLSTIADIYLVRCTGEIYNVSLDHAKVLITESNLYISYGYLNTSEFSIDSSKIEIYNFNMHACNINLVISTFVGRNISSDKMMLYIKEGSIVNIQELHGNVEYKLQSGRININNGMILDSKEYVNYSHSTGFSWIVVTVLIITFMFLWVWHPHISE